MTPGTGGPAGNARLTAWTGLLLLVLFVAELVTLLNMHQLITWHLVIGVLLVPPALVKTVSTGWRIVRYYTRNEPYYQAGPPSPLLRALGPLVVIFTLGLLGSGLALIALGQDSSHTVLVRALGQRVDAVTVHQGMFILWGVVTGLHLLARLVPALRLTVLAADRESTVPGGLTRGLVLVATVLVAVLSTVLVVSAAGDWRSQPSGRFSGPPGQHHR